MKNNFFFLFLALSIIGCKRTYDNPYDANTNPDLWSPDSLNVTITDSNTFLISWIYNESRIDHFTIENRKNNSIFKINKTDRIFNDTSTVQLLSCGFEVDYILYANAGDNLSSEESFTDCFSNSVSLTLPVINSISITNITATSAQTGGNITNSGSSNVTQRGVCWSTNTSPLITDNITSNGSGTGSFTSNLSNLNPNTTYYLRAYATNGSGTAYGNQLTFTTQNNSSIPTLTSSNVSNITTNSAQSGGNITNDGGATVTQRGVCWSNFSNPTTSNNTTSNGTGTGSFASALSSLNANTTYYIRAYATNSSGTAYGNQLSFTTQNNLTVPTLTTSSVSNITTNSAQSGGNITNNGGSAVTQRGICWSTSSSPTMTDNTTSNGSGTGSFASTLSNLNANTTYYIRAYATNSSGTAYGNQLSFTSSGPILVSTNNCNSLINITSNYQGMNGTSSNWGIGTGYSGNGWKAPDPNNSGQLGTAIGNHYVEFQESFSNNGYLEFWCNTFNAGYDNVLPTIIIDGTAIGSAVKIQGNSSNSSFYWMKVRTPIISSGSHTVKIMFSTQYMVVGVDEIEKWE